MNPTDFRQRLRAGDALIGTMVTLPTAATAEILADVGFDWLFVDAEHGPLDATDLLGILQAVGDRVPCIVRVPLCDEGWIKRVLDLGAQGIIVPQTNTPEIVSDVVRYARYAPAGSRGVGLARAHGYGFRFDEYVASANEHVAVIVQAEHRLAVANIEEIVAVPGIDAVLLGPYDMSASYGKMGQITDPEITSAIARVITTCRSAGISVGSFGVTADAVRTYAEQGCSLLCAGVDVLFLGGGARKMHSEVVNEQ
ncbi:MAG: aldolase/citrate lyase family protein [Fuerstiella sp.]|nr:aldolase/citrate lyase family protein [Fuerstiella sp.]